MGGPTELSLAVYTKWTCCYDDKIGRHHYVARALLWALRQVHRHKDRDLARRLRETANEYDPRPENKE